MEQRPNPDLFWTWVNTTLVGVFIVRDGVFAWVNDRFQHDTGYTAAELVGRPTRAIVMPADYPAVREQAVAMLQRRRTEPYDYRFLTKMGETRWALETVTSIPYQGERAVLGNVMDITERKQLERRLEYRAFYDALTGLANRNLFLDRLTHALRRDDRHPAGIAVLYTDLDGFKSVNDTHGHAAGDELLVAVAERLRGIVRACDTASRFGGDEFTVLLEWVTDTEALQIAERVRQAVEEPYDIHGHAVRIGVSIGVAFGGSDRSGEQDLLRRADVALYQAKAAGKGRVVLAPPPSG